MDHVRDLQPRHAIDLGCGSGNEAWQLIQGGWQVLAIDKEPEAIVRTIRKCSMAEARRLTAEVADFEHLAHLPPSALIHAGLALPFCGPNRFPNLWCQIRNALVLGGVFVGHFFGLRHSWASAEQISFHCVEDIRRLSEGFEIVLLRESESSMVIDSGAVNWHRINVIVRKPHQ
ncbi:class I SAM-dependent methyltransferase [Pseudomonas putida]|uniref:class I SAM-dependent methyltransferase n=1 Tax=Pseudomonas putida TaxID=303 RepID=UPI001E577056|nr:methyltransferase domain-containing protein [Pseudomonas putida]